MTAFAIAFGALMLGLAIAFGLGGRDAAKQLFDQHLRAQQGRNRMPPSSVNSRQAWRAGYGRRVCAYTAKCRSPRARRCAPAPDVSPRRFGIDLGSNAFEFIEMARRGRATCLAVLPLGPTGYGNSPYQSFSAFAGNPLLISLDELIEDGLLTAAACSPEAFAKGDVDFPAVIEHRQALWPRVLDRFDQAAPAAVRDRFDRFCLRNAGWLSDYALFMAVKAAHDHTAWTTWQPEIAARAAGGCAVDGPLFARDPHAPADAVPLLRAMAARTRSLSVAEHRYHGRSAHFRRP